MGGALLALLSSAFAADAGTIEIDVRGATDYYGPLYAGSDYRLNHVVYDTMSDWTVLLEADAENQQILNNYDMDESSTAKTIMAGGSIPTEQTVDFGSFSFEGPRVTDQFCLSDNQFCVPDFEFVAAKNVLGSFSANGVLGLAPSGDQRSFVKALKAAGKIEDEIVSFNYENPEDRDQRSQVQVGGINYAEIEGGADGLNYYNNLAIGKWGLMMDDLLYDDVDVTGDHKAKIALIDSGNTSIQIPNTMFLNLKAEMKKADSTIYEQEVEGNTILVARRACHELEDKLGNIEFMLQNTRIIIKPRGYIYHLADQNKDCFIGISSLPDSHNQYRLGTVFLRNFYTALDFSQNLIIIGLNKGAHASSSVEGHVGNPFIRPEDSHYVALSIILLVVVVLVVFVYLLTGRKNDQGLTAIQSFKGKGGKPSKSEQQIRAINESINESLVESLDDNDGSDEELAAARTAAKVTRSMSISEPTSKNDILKEKLKQIEKAKAKKIVDDEQVQLKGHKR